jgi:hypothetical protein
VLKCGVLHHDIEFNGFRNILTLKIAIIWQNTTKTIIILTLVSILRKGFLTNLLKLLPTSNLPINIPPFQKLSYPPPPPSPLMTTVSVSKFWQVRACNCHWIIKDYCIYYPSKIHHQEIRSWFSVLWKNVLLSSLHDIFMFIPLFKSTHPFSVTLPHY